MKRNVGPLLTMALVYSISGCGATADPLSTNGASDRLDQTGLLAALGAAGATPEIGDPIVQDFFSVEGRLVNLNETEGFQVFEYESPEDMENDASKVAADGGSVGTVMINWVMPPHFFKAGRVIVLYLGSDETTLGLLQKIMGKQFAGQ